MTAAGNATRISEAKNKISKAILGIIVLFSSFLILYTINPDLVGGEFSLPAYQKTTQKRDYETEDKTFHINTHQELPPAVEGEPYLATIEAKGGVPPYTFSITNGTLPSGLKLETDGNTAVISGILGPVNQALLNRNINFLGATMVLANNGEAGQRETKLDILASDSVGNEFAHNVIIPILSRRDLEISRITRCRMHWFGERLAGGEGVRHIGDVSDVTISAYGFTRSSRYQLINQNLDTGSQVNVIFNSGERGNLFIIRDKTIISGGVNGYEPGYYMTQVVSLDSPIPQTTACPSGFVILDEKKESPHPDLKDRYFQDTLKASNYFEWDNLNVGFKKLPNGQIYYDDFALIIMSSNKEPTIVEYSFLNSQGQEITPSKKITLNQYQTYQILGSELLPFDGESLIFKNKTTFMVKAPSNIYIFGPDTFKARGEGRDMFEAAYNAWWDGGDFAMQSSYAVEGNKILFPYFIHWHNFENWPEGWDTIITLRNKSNTFGMVEIEPKPYYSTLWGDDQGCFDSPRSLNHPSKGISVRPKSDLAISLRDILDIKESYSHQSEGGLIVTVPDISQWEVYARVVSYPTGIKKCNVLVP